MPAAPRLEDDRVWLEPLTMTHAPGLWAVGQDRDIWRYMTAEVRSEADLRTWVAARLAPVADGTALAFCQVDPATGRPVGATSLFAIDAHHRRMEIGHTWLAPAVHRTGVNVAAKRLLLHHAFEALGANRVQLKTDARNLRAQRAIAALGAVREGVLRQHDVLPDGHVRDAVVYSVVRAEWPRVAAHLDARLRRISPPHASSP